jgi:hypothetical protein
MGDEMSQEICKCSLSDDTCPDCLAQDNEALRINNSVLLDYQNELMERLTEPESEKQKLIELFKNCRDSTGYSDEYFRGMYNGIEWARSCIEKDCPEYKDSVEKTVPIYVPTIAEMTEEK